MTVRIIPVRAHRSDRLAGSHVEQRKLGFHSGRRRYPGKATKSKPAAIANHVKIVTRIPIFMTC